MNPDKFLQKKGIKTNNHKRKYTLTVEELRQFLCEYVTLCTFYRIIKDKE